VGGSSLTGVFQDAGIRLILPFGQRVARIIVSLGCNR
jgi:hypothetical protein